MGSIEKVNLLCNLAHQIGNNIAYVQAGGGNISYKIDDTVMLIKSSGLSMLHLQPDKGWVTVNYRMIANDIMGTEDEGAYVSLLNKHTINHMPGACRPSMETGFHAFLGPVVLHTHSVYVNVLTCAEQGKALAQHLLPNAIWIEYATPGIALARSIAQTKSTRSDVQIFLLQNHGIVVSGNDPQQVYEAHETINDHIRQYFALEKFKEFPVVAQSQLTDLILFPDEAIYLATPGMRKTSAAIQISLI